jgi:hypothetical protein
MENFQLKDAFVRLLIAFLLHELSNAGKKYLNGIWAT